MSSEKFQFLILKKASLVSKKLPNMTVSKEESTVSRKLQLEANKAAVPPHQKYPERVRKKLLNRDPRVVYFLSSLRAQTAKTLICPKSGFRRFQKECHKVRKTALSVHFLHTKRGFLHFLALFLESAETPLFGQINVFAVWALRLDRQYTTLGVPEGVNLWSAANGGLRDGGLSKSEDI